MKTYIISFIILAATLIGCNSKKDFSSEEAPKLVSDTIRIANDELEYEVIIIDAGFQSWFNTRAKPRNYYTQSYLEGRNQFWVSDYNRRATFPTQNNADLYTMPINYENSIDYGFEVNYMIFNYLLYFQQTNRQSLGGFMAR